MASFFKDPEEIFSHSILFQLLSYCQYVESKKSLCQNTQKHTPSGDMEPSWTVTFKNEKFIYLFTF